MSGPTNYETMKDADRWPLFVEEYGLPSLKQWLRARWNNHVQQCSNGEHVNGVWDNGYDSKPYWALDRATDLTHWGLGVNLSRDVWGKRWDLGVQFGPVSIGLSRSDKVM